ncbi:MAG: DUF167 domain-containing protein [Bacteroidetes bacterium]|nr:DUF167 domain-containing protein [Bacteroidota bacterium]
MALNITEFDNGIKFDVFVKPNSKKQSVKISNKKGFFVSVVNAAVKGSATKELLSLLKNILKQEVVVHSVSKNHQKTLFVSNITKDEFKKCLNIK